MSSKHTTLIPPPQKTHRVHYLSHLKEAVLMRPFVEQIPTMQRLQKTENTKRLEYKSKLTNTIQTTLYDTQQQSSWKMHCNMTNAGNKVFLYYVLTT